MKTLLFCGICSLTFTLFGQIPSYVPTTGLSAWYSFSGNSADSSGNNLHLTNYNATLMADRFGNNDKAYNFDGDVNTYMHIPNPSNEILDAGTGDFSISLWFNVDSSNVNTLLHKRRMSGLTNNEGFTFATRHDSTNNTLVFALEDINENGQYFETDFPVNDGVWHHGVVVRNTSKDSLYMWFDGELVSTIEDITVTTTATSEDLYVGRWINYDNTTYNNALNGYIDEIGVWKHALTACEIQDLYNNGLNSVLNSVTQNGTELMVDQNNATYQWLDCNNDSTPVQNETNQSFTPSTSGDYSVEVDMNGCTVYSDCHRVDFVGINEYSNDSMNEKEVLMILDQLGRETNFKPNTPLIYIYTDGTSKRIFKSSH